MSNGLLNWIRLFKTVPNNKRIHSDRKSIHTTRKIMHMQIPSRQHILYQSNWSLRVFYGTFDISCGNEHIPCDIFVHPLSKIEHFEFTLFCWNCSHLNICSLMKTWSEKFVFVKHTLFIWMQALKCVTVRDTKCLYKLHSFYSSLLPPNLFLSFQYNGWDISPILNLAAKKTI